MLLSSPRTSVCFIVTVSALLVALRVAVNLDKAEITLVRLLPKSLLGYFLYLIWDAYPKRVTTLEEHEFIRLHI